MIFILNSFKENKKMTVLNRSVYMIVLIFILTLVKSIGSEANDGALLSEFSSSELRCLANRKVLYRDVCHNILSRGPCNSNERLMLDKTASMSGQLRPVVSCRRCLCCDKNYQLFWPSDGRCHNAITEKRALCPLLGTEPQSDYFGEGECSCISQPPHMRLETNINGACYEIYQTGPCRRNQIFVPKDAISGIGYCVTDPCASHTARYQKQHARHNDGNCYELGGKRPCVNAEVFIVSPLTFKPECYSSVLYVFNTSSRCHTDPNTQQCVEEIKHVKTVQQFSASTLLKYHCRKQAGKKKSKLCP